MSKLFTPKAEWYVIRVISGTEENVRTSLMQRREMFNLEKSILDCFVPLHDVVTLKKGGGTTKQKKNIFPGYILVKMIVNNESWYVVRNTPNVTGFLGAGTIPVPVSEEELLRIQGMVDEKNAEYKTPIKIGDYATVLEGSFKNSEGKIIEVNEKKGTLKLTVNLLGRDTPVELEFGQIKIKH
ncbi:MAG: transcription termination/antitermination protein NusG [Candidatus Gracilibacteria bacterium]|jgi:transcriptional antiterminator NusG